MTAHFDHGASSAKRWMNCPSSIKHMKDNPLPDTKDSTLGTERHTLVEDMWLKPETLEEWDYDQDDWDNAVAYCDLIRDCVKRVGKTAVVVIESQIALELHGEKVGGTPDCLVYTQLGELHTIDFKGGFEEVDIIGNEQLLTYDQAACAEYEIRPTAVYHHIFQPNSLGTPWKTVEVQMKELWDFRDELTVAVKATKVGKSYLSGKWCEWCNKSMCPEWMSKQAETTGTDLANKGFEIPDLAKYDTDRLLRIKKAMPLITRMGKEVDAMLHQRAMAGQKVTGQKLVVALKNRAWIDEDKVIEEFGEKVVVTTKKVMSPAQVEKNFQENTDALTKREENGYKLVSKSAGGVEYTPDAGFGDEVLETIA